MSIVIFPLITGYIAKIYRGDQPAPRYEEGGLFIMGLKLIFAVLIYAIPVIAVFAHRFLCHGQLYAVHYFG